MNRNLPPQAAAELVNKATVIDLLAGQKRDGMTERSNSFEQIELLPASPPSLEASISSGGTTPARTVEKEKEREGEDIVKSKPAAQITHRRPASLLRKSNGRADAEGEKNAPSRYFVL